MEGMLLEDLKVAIDPRAVTLGGSWFPEPSGAIPKAYDMKMIRFFYERVLGFDRPRILDIGANTGSFCLLAKALPNLRGFAVEPNPDVFAVLVENLSLNGVTSQIEAVQVAIGERSGEAVLRVPPPHQGVSGLATLGNPLRFREYTEVKVPMVTLDDFVSSRLPDGVDLLKIDTEGSELQVLTGGRSVLEKHRPGVLAEFNGTNTRQRGYGPEKIIYFMMSLGYTWTQVGPEDVYFRHLSNV